MRKFVMPDPVSSARPQLNHCLSSGLAAESYPATAGPAYLCGY